MADGILSPCNVACGYGIMTLNSPSGSTLQCGTWLKDDMPLNSPGGTLRCGTWLWDHDIEFASWQHPAMWHVALRWHANEFAQTSDWKFTSGFDFDHYHTAVDVSFWTNLRNSIQIGPPTAEKNNVMPIFKTADLRHIGLWGSSNRFFEKPIYDFL